MMLDIGMTIAFGFQVLAFSNILLDRVVYKVDRV